MSGPFRFDRTLAGGRLIRYEMIGEERVGIPNGVGSLIEYDLVKGIRTLQCNQIFNSN